MLPKSERQAERVREAREEIRRERGEFGGLSERTFNTLRAYGITDMSELRAYAEKHGHPSGWNFYNYGKKGAAEVATLLALEPAAERERCPCCGHIIRGKAEGPPALG